LLKLHGWIGLGIIGISEILLYNGANFVKTYFTPLAWTGYILFIDSLVFRQRGRSLMVNRLGEFLFMLFLSIGLWLIFEFYNLFIRNWHYVGLPEDPLPRWIGYGWAFATIWPAILLTAESLENWSFITKREIRPVRIKATHLRISFFFGIVCLIFPLMVSSSVAHYLAGPVWLGFIFFLDPLNYWLGGRSLFRDLQRGNPKTLYSLLLSGFFCGWLWEFWNYWAGAKWHYTVPILGQIKVFEMPFVGYLGFPPFAVECFVMYSFCKVLFFPGKNHNGSNL
jgi:hypothetical protein